MKFAWAVAAAALLLSAQTMFPPVRGTHHMVAAANNQEVEAGYRILERGGNAVDAGVATVLTAAVTEQSRFGLGGEMPLLVRMKGKPTEAISGVGTAPALATVDFFAHRKPEEWEVAERLAPIPGQGIRAAIVPGAIGALLLALKEHGTMSFGEVAQPAIEYAGGFPIAEEFAGMLRAYRPMLALWPASFHFYYPDGGEAPQAGDLMRFPNLENTLRRMVAVEKKTRGNRRKKIDAVREYFYRGDIARRLAAFSEQNGGLIRYDDLATFHADSEPPVAADFAGYTVYKPGFWTQGPVMIEALNILRGFDLKAMGHNSPEYLHTLIETAKLAFADRDRYYGDPKFSKIPADILLSQEYADARRKLIDPEHASMEHRPGDFGPKMDLGPGTPGPSTANDTTCVNVVDDHGNAFSATPSGAWLPSVIAGDTGIPFTTRLQSFVLTPGHPNQLAPGKRPRVTLSPTVVTRNGELAMIMSTPGGDNQDQALLQVLLNIIVFGMPTQAAVEAPRFQSDHLYESFDYHEFMPGKVRLEGRIPVETADRLRALGHDVVQVRPWGNSSSPTVIQVKDGVLNGAADPRRARFVFGR